MKKKVTKVKSPAKAKSGKSSKPAPKSKAKKIAVKPVAKAKSAKKGPVAPKPLQLKSAPSRSGEMKSFHRPAPQLGEPRASARKVVLPEQAELSVPAAPTRAPIRKIMGRESGSSVIVERVPQIPVPVVAEVIEVPKPAPRAVPTAPAVKIAWDKVPHSIPSQYRFLAATAKAECEKAASWPFASAKFISSLPQEMCGLEFALLAMRLDHSFESVRAISGLSEEALENALLRGGSAIEEQCATICPDISRKLRSHLSGTRSATASLIEPNKIAQVDWAFQIMLADMIIMSLKGNLVTREGVNPLAEAS